MYHSSDHQFHPSLNLRLNPAEEGLVAGFAIALGALGIRGSAAHRNVRLLLLIGNDGGLVKGRRSQVRLRL